MRAPSELSTPSIKSVHFREEDNLEEVRVYNRAGRPANLLFKDAAETETETEAENVFPFSRTPVVVLVREGHGPAVKPCASAVAGHVREHPPQVALVAQDTISRHPRHVVSSARNSRRVADIRRPTGSVLVRNVSFAKDVAVRFTFDGWQTTFEVHGEHVVSLLGLQPPFPRPNTAGDAVGLVAGGGTTTPFSTTTSASARPPRPPSASGRPSPPSRHARSPARSPRRSS
jgi:hypothetical protein